MRATRETAPKLIFDTARKLRVVTRLVALLLFALLGLVAQLCLRLLSKLVSTGNAESVATRYWHRGICWLIGLRIQLVGTPPVGAHLVVSNHVSWLDIPVLGGILPVCFLSKAEVRSWPLMGWLATMAYTVYIERGAHGARGAGEQLIARLKQGRSVVLFPEGTTGDGKSVRRFMPRLFMAAIAAERSVQPVAVRYPSINGVESVAPFFGGESMGSHMLKVLAEPYIEVQVTLCRPISEVEERRRLTELSREAIRVAIGQDLRN